MSKKQITIKFIRDSAWAGKLVKLPININDTMNLSLSEGEERLIVFDSNVKKLDIEAGKYMEKSSFLINDIQQVKEVHFRYRPMSVGSSVLYQNDNLVTLTNKNKSLETVRLIIMTIWIVALCLMFMMFMVCMAEIIFLMS